LENAAKFYVKKIKKNWTKYNSYQQALLCFSLAHWGEKDLSDNIYTSLNEKMVVDEEQGNYWNDQAGYYWYNLNIEKQALMIELFKDREAEQKVIDNLKLWLLKNKQVNSWKTTKETTAAVYAFLLDKDEWLSQSKMIAVSHPQLKQNIDFEKKTSGTGYMKKVWSKNEITANHAQLEVKNPNNHVSWGAAYWQYFEDLDAITSFEETPLNIKKQVYKVEFDENGEVLKSLSEKESIFPGDKLRIKIELHVDRPMEFIEMKDMRSSGLEPFNVMSQYKWQDGLGYYESTKDVATYFYFSRIPKGNYVFEYDVFAAHTGTFSNGITQLQSVYAPEFSSHSDGISLTIVKE